jgi:hypothetical protein
VKGDQGLWAGVENYTIIKTFIVCAIVSSGIILSVIIS